MFLHNCVRVVVCGAICSGIMQAGSDNDMIRRPGVADRDNRNFRAKSYDEVGNGAPHAETKACHQKTAIGSVPVSPKHQIETQR